MRSFRRRYKRQPKQCTFRAPIYAEGEHLIPGLAVRCRLPLHGHHQHYETWQGKPAVYHTNGDYIWGEVLSVDKGEVDG